MHGQNDQANRNFSSSRKGVYCTFTLGNTTPSYDLETEFNETFPTEHITSEMLNNVVKQMTGLIEQTPPIYSAVKVNGRRAYESARKGEDVKLKVRTVDIKVFEIDKTLFPKISFKIVCSKGTYIRSMANDFGKKLQSGAYLSELRRTKIGNFSINDSLEVIEAAEKINIARESL